MARFLAMKHLSSLRPVDEAGEAALQKLSQGQIVSVEIKQSRNIHHHRMFWALMTIVWENMDHERYPNVEDFTGAIKIAAGLRTRIVLPNGDVGFMPGSIAFHKMDQIQFSEFYNRVCDLIAEHFLPGVTTEDLRNEVSAMIGITNNSNSSATSSRQMKPAATDAPPSEAAGNPSSHPSPGDETSADGVETQAPSALPAGWAIRYAAALREAKTKKDLTPAARRFWALHGSWNDHKDGPDGATASAIFDAFNHNFGDREQIETLLRELV
jgi:hypothetical protein